jgi:hypothetical protein
MVQTDRGLIPIEKVCPGDMVLTHTNDYHRVKKIGNQKSNEIINIKIMGSPAITTTEGHPFYVRQSKKDYSIFFDNGVKKRHNRKGMLEAKWMKAKDLEKGYYICYAINQNSVNAMELTEEECYLIGRYVADGYINESLRPHRKNSYNHKVIFCIGGGKLDAFMDNVSEYHVCAKVDKTVTKCEVISQRLVELCKACGKGAINKTFPQFIMDLPCHLLEKVIDGYMSGDGCFSVRYQATTISKSLAYQLQQVVAKVYHTYAKVYYSIRPPKHIIQGRIVNQHNTYVVQFQKEIRKQDKYIYEDNMLWIPFIGSRKIDKPDTVYNMEVAIDNSYTANGFIVHNCQSLSIAGKRAGMSKFCPKCGYKVVGNDEATKCPICAVELEYTRSGLFMEQIRIVKEMREASERRLRSRGSAFNIRCIRPRFMLWENVCGAFTSNKGEDFRAVIEEIIRISEPGISIPRPEGGAWKNQGAVVGDGYSLAWRVLDAQYWGVPQRRKRIALVADFGGESAPEILFKSEGLSGDFKTGGEEGQDSTANTEKGVGMASGTLPPPNMQ